MSDEPLTEAQVLDEARKAKFLLEHEYFRVFTHEMELAAMEEAVVGPTPERREEARIEVLLVRKLRGYLHMMANMPADFATARKGLAAHE